MRRFGSVWSVITAENGYEVDNQFRGFIEAVKFVIRYRYEK